VKETPYIFWTFVCSWWHWRRPPRRIV